MPTRVHIRRPRLFCHYTTPVQIEMHTNATVIAIILNAISLRLFQADEFLIRANQQFAVSGHDGAEADLGVK